MMSAANAPRAGRYAVIDLGTVTCRMLVADVDASGELHELRREYAIVNLGEGVDASGALAPATVRWSTILRRRRAPSRSRRSPRRQRAMPPTKTSWSPDLHAKTSI